MGKKRFDIFYCTVIVYRTPGRPLDQFKSRMQKKKIVRKTTTNKYALLQYLISVWNIYQRKIWIVYVSYSVGLSATSQRCTRYIPKSKNLVSIFRCITWRIPPSSIDPNLISPGYVDFVNGVIWPNSLKNENKDTAICLICCFILIDINSLLDFICSSTY